jgi:DNA end-binding protein Ku
MRMLQPLQHEARRPADTKVKPRQGFPGLFCYNTELMRAIWKGHISFALVTIPVSLFSATKRNEISLHYLHKGDLSPVSYKRFCDAEDKEVAWEDLTRGYEYEKGQYVEITDEDMDKADVELTKTIQVMEFVSESEIDPVYFDKPYYLEPQKGGERAYALMRDALAHSGKVGIARVVLKSREHLAAVKPVGKMIMLGMMRFAHEIVDPSTLQLPDASVPSGKEMDLARTLIDSMTDTFEPTKYRDDYHDKVLAVIQAKIQGVSLKPGQPAPKPGKVVDLMEILKQSLVETQKKEPAAAGRTRKAK